MMRIADCSESELKRSLESTGLYLTTGPFVFHVRSPLEDLLEGIRTLYGDFPLIRHQDFADHHVELRTAHSLRKWIRPEIQFFHDGEKPFFPVTFNQAFAVFEWGMNWCISIFPNQYLKLHAAVLEKNGKAVVMPGVPGAGKSTLSAALTLSGWRLLSDEHALITLDWSGLVPLCRPVGLKNESIDIIKSFSRDAVLGPISTDTHKGTVAHMKADLSPQSHDATPVKMAWLIFPQYLRGSSTQLTSVTRGEALIRAAKQSFNYSTLGRRGFDALANAIEEADCFDFQYSNLDEALKTFDNLAA